MRCSVASVYSCSLLQLATELMPDSDEHLRLAAQCGVSEITRYRGPLLTVCQG